jgi:putative PEP-CTERM system TPR-repeat lipoprotein
MNRLRSALQPVRARGPRQQVLAAALVAALALAGCGDKTEPELIAGAKASIGKSDVEAAKVQLKSALQLNGDSGEARLLLGKLLLDTGDVVGAEVELRRAVELKQSENTVVPLLATALVAQGKGKEALAMFGKTTLTDGKADLALKIRLAEAEAMVDNIDGALAILANVLKANPEPAQARILNARLTAFKGNAADAMAQLDALITRDPTQAEAFMVKGDLQQRGLNAATPPDMPAAMASYRQAIKLRAGYLAAHIALTSLLINQDDFAGVKAELAELQKIAPRHPQTMFFDAIVAEREGDLKKARELIQQLLRGTASNVQVLMLAGQIETKLNNLGLAETHYAKAMQAAPKAASPRRQLAQILLRTGQADKALTALKPLLEADPPDVEALTLSAQALMTKGDTSGADGLYARATKLKPDDPRVRTAVALSSLSKGNSAGALNDLQAIAASDKGTGADIALINARIRLNDLPGALKAVDGLAAKLPKDPLPDHLRGRIEVQRKDAAAARKHFEAALAKNPDYIASIAGLSTLDLADKKPAEAKARFEELLKRQPTHTGAMMALADLALRTGGTTADAIAWLNKAVQADPSDLTPRLLLVDRLLDDRQFKLALDTAQVGLTTQPDNLELLDRVGRGQMLSGDARQAVTTFTKLSTLAPTSPLAQLRLADAHAALNDRAGAAAAVKRAAELAPDALQVQQAKFNLAKMEGQPDQALAVARKVQAKSPTEAAGFAMEGEVELRRKNLEAAIVVLRKAVALKQPGESAQRLHGALVATKKAAEADKFADEWRKAHPDDHLFVLHLGDIALAAGDAPKAEGLYREVVARFPDNIPAHNNLAYALATQKKPGAVAEAEQAVKRAPKAPEVLDTMAFALASEGQLPKALEVQLQAVALAPEAHVFRLQLAKFHLQSGDKASARTELARLAKVGAAFSRQAEVAELAKQAAE